MSDGTKIEWAANADGTPGASWNPIRARNRKTGAVGWFCTHASPGCVGCYAEAMNNRLGTAVAFKAQNAADVELFIDETMLTLPVRWRKPRTIFVCSMTDLFGEFVTDAFIDRLMSVAMSPATQHHTFIVLTKRGARMRAYFESFREDGQGWLTRNGVDGFKAEVGVAPNRWPLPNVWLGVSVEDQRRADERIPDLLATPASTRFLSVEPLIAPVDLSAIARKRGDGFTRPLDGRFNTIDWVIVGGESGAKARPMCLAWARAIRDQCAAAGVAFFFKQWGEFAPVKVFDEHDTLIRAGDGVYGAPGAVHGANIYPMRRLGKRAAGRLLDGRTHDDRPTLACEVQP